MDLLTLSEGTTLTGHWHFQHRQGDMRLGSGGWCSDVRRERPLPSRWFEEALPWKT